MPQIIETHRNEFTITNDPTRLDMNTICDLLSHAYWTKGRPRERTEDAIKNSLVFGVYAGSKQIGVARVVTDYNIFAYLLDVFIHEDYRGQGLGTWLIETILTHPDLATVRRWMLTTDDMHALYKKFDFTPLDHPENWMQRIRPFHGEA